MKRPPPEKQQRVATRILQRHRPATRVSQSRVLPPHASRIALATVVALAIAVTASCDEPPATLDAGTASDAGHDAGHDAGPRCTAASGLPDPLACNGHAALCDRAYDAVSFPMTHNAMSSEEDGWTAPNQGRNLWHQLEDGVRGFMLDTYEDRDGTLLLCHGACGFLGQRPLSDALFDLREFMDCHPAEVITIIFEPHVSEAVMARGFEEAGMLGYLHEQPLGAPWPTLRAMIESGRRLVVFTESSATSLPWYHHAYSYAWDNDYAARTAADFDCAPNRGTGDEPVFVLNHFLTAPVAMRSLAEMVNYESLREHAERCELERAQLPNFVAVDFYDASDLFDVVDALNDL